MRILQLQMQKKTRRKLRIVFWETFPKKLLPWSGHGWWCQSGWCLGWFAAPPCRTARSPTVQHTTAAVVREGVGRTCLLGTIVRRLDGGRGWSMKGALIYHKTKMVPQTSRGGAKCVDTKIQKNSEGAQKLAFSKKISKEWKNCRKWTENAQLVQKKQTNATK